MTPDQQQARYDHILTARLRHPGFVEGAVQAELEAAGVDFSEEGGLRRPLIRPEQREPRTRGGIIAWHNRRHGKELTYDELAAVVDGDPGEWLYKDT